MSVPLNLEEIVVKPTWRSILVDLIVQNKIDPWDVDIDVIVSGFIDKIREMKELDLVIPGNVILASSILLKFKALRFSLVEGEEEIDDSPLIVKQRREMPIRIPPKRPITLNELFEAIEKALKYEKRFVERAARRPTQKTLQLTKTMVDIEEDSESVESKMKRVVDLLLSNMDEYGYVNLTSLMSREEDALFRTQMFIFSLFLAKDGKIDIIQDEFFGDVVVKVIEPQGVIKA